MSRSHEFVIIMYKTDHVHPKWTHGSSFYSVSGQRYWRAVPVSRCQDLTPNTHIPLQRAAEGRQCFSPKNWDCLTYPTFPYIY